jgi:hypothetical protein
MKTTKIKEVLENSFKLVCDDMVSRGDVKDIDSQQLYEKYIDHFTKMPEKTTSTTGTTGTTGNSSGGRKKSAKQFWYADTETKELIKDYNKQHPLESGKPLPFQKGVTILWAELDKAVQDKFIATAANQ